MSDINVVAHGINPETGEYLSPAERKALFKKGRMGSKIDPSAFKSDIISGVKAAEKVRQKAEADVGGYADLEREMDKLNEDAAGSGGGSNVSGGGGSGGGVVAIVPISEVASGALSTDVQELEEPVQKVRVDVDDAPPEQSEESKESFKDALKKLLETLKRITKLKTKQGKASKKTDKLNEKGKKKKKKERKTPGRDIFGIGRKVSGKATKVFGDIFGIFGDILAFAALNWISDPKNRKAVQTIVGFLGHAFKFIDYVVTGFIDNTLTGLSQLLGPDRTIGERFSGALKLLGSFFLLRWLKNPFRIIKDVKRIFKLTKGFAKFVNKILRKPIKMIQNFVQKALNKTLGKLFMSNLFKPLRKFIIQVGGKSLFKLLGAVGRGFTKLISRLPFIGALLQFFLDVFIFKQPPGRSAFKAIGGALVGLIGAGLGPIGAFLGGWAGSELGGILYDNWFGGGSSDKDSKKSESTSGSGKTPAPTSTNAGGSNTPVAQSTDVQANIDAIVLAAKDMNYTGDLPSLLAIAKGESGIKGIPEQPITSADRASQIWSISKSEAQQLLDSGGWRALYNEVYGWSGNQLGNRPGTNDGSDFIGRGFIQITGRHNYNDIGKRIGVDFMSNPDLLLDKDIAAKATIAFMQRAGSPKDMESALRAVGGIRESWPKKRSYYKEFQSYGGGTGIPLRKDYPMGRAGAKQFKIARKAYSAKLTSKTPKNSTFATESASFTINEKLKNNQTSSTFIINSVEENNVGMNINSLNLNKGKKSGNQILSRL